MLWLWLGLSVYSTSCHSLYIISMQLIFCVSIYKLSSNFHSWWYMYMHSHGDPTKAKQCKLSPVSTAIHLLYPPPPRFSHLEPPCPTLWGQVLRPWTIYSLQSAESAIRSHNVWVPGTCVHVRREERWGRVICCSGVLWHQWVVWDSEKDTYTVCT